MCVACEGGCGSFNACCTIAVDDYLRRDDTWYTADVIHHTHFNSGDTPGDRSDDDIYSSDETKAGTGSVRRGSGSRQFGLEDAEARGGTVGAAPGVGAFGRVWIRGGGGIGGGQEEEA